MIVLSESVSGPGRRATIDDRGESLLVKAGITVASSDDTAIQGDNDHLSAIIQGTVIGQNFGTLLGLFSTDDSNRVSVAAGGQVFGLVGTGVFVTGFSAAVSNAGTIFGGQYGVGLAGNPLGANQDRTSIVNNSGAIEGIEAGIHVEGSTPFNVSNRGTIKGFYSFIDSGQTANVITNTGTMQATSALGGLFLGKGNDTYNGKTGHALGGTIDGGAGNDTIAAGTEANRISGGEGRDTLFGGKGDDAFVFDAAVLAANADVIQDFAQVAGNNDRLELDNAYFTKLGNPGALAGKLFKDISAAKQDADDRVLYKHATGDLLYDADGLGAGKAVLFAHLSTKPALTFADFIVI